MASRDAELNIIETAKHLCQGQVTWYMDVYEAKIVPLGISFNEGMTRVSETGQDGRFQSSPEPLGAPAPRTLSNSLVLRVIWFMMVYDGL